MERPYVFLRLFIIPQVINHGIIRIIFYLTSGGIMLFNLLFITVLFINTCRSILTVK